MATNPEFEHEFREGKQNEPQKPIIYRDHDNVNEAFEMAYVLRDAQKTSPLQGLLGLLLKIILVAAAVAIGSYLLFGLIPDIIRYFNPDHFIV